MLQNPGEIIFAIAIRKGKRGLVLVAHARRQKKGGSRFEASQANSSRDPISKSPPQK
jgi:hypothetical protein